MPNIPLQIDELIVKFLNGILDNSERLVLENWINASDANKKVFENLTDKEWVATELEKIYQFNENAGWETIATSLNPRKEDRSIRPYWYKWVAAAVVLIAVGTGYWSYTFNCSHGLDKNLSQEQRFGKDIKAPESNKAILTLAD